MPSFHMSNLFGFPAGCLERLWVQTFHTQVHHRACVLVCPKTLTRDVRTCLADTVSSKFLGFRDVLRLVPQVGADVFV